MKRTLTIATVCAALAFVAGTTLADTGPKPSNRTRAAGKRPAAKPTNKKVSPVANPGLAFDERTRAALPDDTLCLCMEDGKDGLDKLAGRVGTTKVSGHGTNGVTHVTVQCDLPLFKGSRRIRTIRCDDFVLVD